MRLFRAAPSVRSTRSRILLSAASAKTSRTPAAVPLKWFQNFAMRCCFEMHILPKRCKRLTASCPGPHAGGEVISFVFLDIQGPARCDPQDGVAAARHRVDAVAATTSCAVRTASKPKNRPPTTRSPGDDAFE